MKNSRVLLAFAVFGVIATGACSRVPTATDRAGPAGPAYAGGHTFGSGNRGGDGTTTAAAPGAPTTAACSEERGGGWVGPGGRAGDPCGIPSQEYAPSLSSEGIGMIGGGRADAGTTWTTSSPTTCEERGGWTAGSGNREEPSPACPDGEAQ
jgi:hypothetical protein